MRKFWALLLTLTMVMQLVALPTARAEGVATPSDITLVCDACKNDPGNIKLTWMDDVLGYHFLQCQHEVVLEKTKHRSSYGINDKPIDSDADGHYYACTSYSGCGVKIWGWHTETCINPGVCTECGATGVSCTGPILHNITDNKAYDDQYHWNECLDCGEVINKLEHYDDCTNRGLCGACGAQDVTFGWTGHHYKSQEHDQQYHWSICYKCGEESAKNTHYGYCEEPGICAECLAENVTLSSVEHAYYLDYGYDANIHWSICPTCGEKLSEGVHYDDCTNPGVCVLCEQSGVTMDHTEHQYDFEGYKFDNANHWRVCLDCGAQGKKWNHTGDCSNPDVCVECGQSGVELADVRHDYDMEHYDYDQYSHWTTCATCGNKQRGLHTSDCLNPDVCWQCGQTGVTMDYVEHIWSPSGSVTWEYDNKEHWLTCVCGEEDGREEHYNLCTDLNTCDGCGATGVEFTSTIHDWNEIEVEYDIEKCWKICRACGEKFGEEYHVALCTRPNVCFYCNKVGVTISEIGHNLVPSAYEHDGEKHWQNCPDCGELYEEEHWPSVEDSTKCSICGGTIQTETPSPIPSEKPSAEPTVSPTEKPTQSPTASPIPLPTEQVTATPTAKPTEQVTATPTAKPTEQVTTAPTAKPTEQATTEPTAKPTEQVTTEPTVEPTEQPTSEPTKKPAPAPTEAPAHEHTFDIAFVSNNDGTHSKACLGNCGEVVTENCHLVTTDMGLMTCTACATCGYAVYTAKEGVAALTEGETVPAKVVRVETAAIAPAAEDAPEAVPADTQLLVHETTFDVPVALSTELKGTVEKVFTATLVKDGETIQPTGKVKLTIPVEEETLAALEGKVLMLMREDGTLIELEYEIIDGEIVFLTDELGVFLLMTPEAK